jgi:hypothetical protein
MTLDEIMAFIDAHADSPAASPEKIEGERRSIRAAIESYAATREREAVEREREACARACEAEVEVTPPFDGSVRALRRARDRIRARGEVKP